MSKFGNTVLNFNDEKQPDMENMEMTYIPKSEHMARLKMYRLDKLKNKIRIKVIFFCLRIRRKRGSDSQLGFIP